MPKEINPLIKGYKKFRKEYFGENKLAYEELVRDGQDPKILVIACSDSRVDPAIVTDCEPGDLFIIRNVANLIPAYAKNSDHLGTCAALEFGVLNLQIRHIIVFGHTSCGGIANLVQTANDPQKHGFISKWVEIARPAYEETIKQSPNASPEEKALLCGQFSLINSLKNLQTFPWIQDKVEQGHLFLHAWHFDLSSGIIKRFDPKENNFVELKEDFWEF